MNLTNLISQLERLSIDEAYALMGYDYADEKRRSLFISKLEWQKDMSTDGVTVFRLFNQINTYYAEQYALSHLRADPLDCIDSCHRLILYRQDKATGYRNGEIEYGRRTELDVLDPRKRLKLIRGIAPHLIPCALAEWGNVVDAVPFSHEAAFMLMMSFIAIHPYVDGNGRLSRVLFTWILLRWGLSESWIAEADDGEMFRVGEGINNTEYLMGAVVRLICGGHNDVLRSDPPKAYDALIQHLHAMRTAANPVGQEPCFQALYNHIAGNRGFLPSSGRFRCLGSSLR